MFKFKRNTRNELNKIWNEIYKNQNFQAKIENAIPVFNKSIEKIKQLEERTTKTIKVLEKMANHIKPKGK